jgi:hypothetical protein
LNDYLLSLILGIVEGITEFLPVSSTAHLRLSEALLHTSGLAPNLTLDNGYWKMYSIVIQLGAILCLPCDLPSRRQRKAHSLDSSPRSHHGRIRGHRDSVIPVDQGDWQASGKHSDHWLVVADRRSRDVGD